MDEKSEFAQRLQDGMTAAGYEPHPAVMERGFNSCYWGKSVTFQAVRRCVKGEAIPSLEKLQVLAEWLKQEPQVLRFGDHVAKGVRASRKRWDDGIGYLERETFASLSLPVAQRKTARDIILALVKASGQPIKSDRK